MKVLQVASECIPIIKTGGLADVVGTLPKALKSLDVECKVALPLYEEVTEKYSHLLTHVYSGSLQSNGGEKQEYKVYSATLIDGDIEVYLFENKDFLSTGKIYFEDDDPEKRQKAADRFAFFNRAVVDFTISDKTWRPDIIHCHDWHTGFIPHLLKENNVRIPTLFTIHNLAMQGISDFDVLNILGHDRHIPDSDIDWDAQDGNIALLLQGILGANLINTVSPTYAKEITVPEFGEGLDKVLKENSNKLYGILNGIDYSSWNPATDAYIMYHYGKEEESVDYIREQKFKNKVALINDLGLTGNDLETLPMFGVVSRMTSQKGFQLLSQVEQKVLENDAFTLVVLGTGDDMMEDMFKSWSKQSQYIHYINKFDEGLAHQIYAASDMFLIPSKFEPCGLTQMISMKYGAVPIVHGVGGLKDTVKNNVDGFVFNEFSGMELWRSINTAVMAYQNTRHWNALIQSSMNANFSWNNSARQYQLLYEKLLGKEIEEVKGK